MAAIYQIQSAMEHIGDINLLPIRRLALEAGEQAKVGAASFHFPGFTLEPLDQVHRRTGPTSYHYESAGGSFRAELEMNAHGLVVEYPGICQAGRQPVAELRADIATRAHMLRIPPTCVR